jgi:hypothetical protein
VSAREDAIEAIVAANADLADLLNLQHVRQAAAAMLDAIPASVGVRYFGLERGGLEQVGVRYSRPWHKHPEPTHGFHVLASDAGPPEVGELVYRIPEDPEPRS